MNQELYIGMLSGTSMDAIDCVLAGFTDNLPVVHDFQCYEIPALLRSKLSSLISNQSFDLRNFGSADIMTGKVFAESANSMLARHKLKPEDITAIGSHGQTIWHQPLPDENGCRFTIQIGDPNTIAHFAGITTIADFRRQDMAAGGQGAPLVPAFHRAIFENTDTARIILNLGGIANITVLPPGRGKPFGYDTGPANILMDEWIRHSRAQDYDDKGAWSREGETINSLLGLFLNDPYFAQRHPKSTGQELFNSSWVHDKLSVLTSAYTAADVQATLTELSARTISDEIKRHLAGGEVLVCGGGIHNHALMEKLIAKLPDFSVVSTEKYGLNPDCVEAVAFAWFARQTLKGIPTDFSPFTGAGKAVIAGGIYQVQAGKSSD